MTRCFLGFLCVCAAIPMLAQHPNVKISSAFNPNEPSICIDPKHPNRLVAGANLNNVFTSSDSGETWKVAQMSSPYGVWGDPVIAVDTAGDFYFLHLSNPSDGSWIDRIVVQKSSDAGQTWSPGTFTGLNNAKAQDKHWIAIDRKTNYFYVCWTEFDKYGSNVASDSSRILFSKSTDAGLTWSTPVRLNKISGDCLDSDNTTEGAVPCVGINGEVFVVWAGPLGLMMDRSLDGGQSWLTEDIKVGDFPGGWDYDIGGLQRCNGLPITACDHSDGPNRGTWYVNWSDQRNGSSDTDVWISKSTNQGNTWSSPVRVNNDPSGKQQFMSWMTIDQATGWIWIVYYDRRAYAANSVKTDVSLAVSKDGGLSFSNFIISDNSFSPNTNQFFGDYTNITAFNNIVRPIWTRQDGTATSVWTALVDVSQVPVGTSTEIGLEIQVDEPNYPNPATEMVWVPFKIRRHTLVTMQVLDQEGNLVHTEFTNRPYEYGKYTEQINLKKLNLKSGTYYVILKGGEKVLNRKLVVFN
jgi:hypothetical protein